MSKVKLFISQHKKLVIVLSILLAAVLIAVGIWGVGTALSPRPEEPIIAYFDASIDADGPAIVDLFPDAVVEEMISDLRYSVGEMDRDDFGQLLTQRLTNYKNYRNSIKESVSYQVTETTRLSKDELAKVRARYQSEYGLTVSDARRVVVKHREQYVSSIDGSPVDIENDFEMRSVKVNDRWYTDRESIPFWPSDIVRLLNNLLA